MFKVDRIHFELASGQWLGLFYQLDGYENMTVLDLGITNSPPLRKVA